MNAMTDYVFSSLKTSTSNNSPTPKPMNTYSTADRESIFAGRAGNYRVNLMRHRYGNKYDRTETKWFAQLEDAKSYAADNGCVVECNMGSEWYADVAFANHNAKVVALITHRIKTSE